MSPILGILASQISGHLWAPTGAYDALASVTVGSGGATSIDFNGIPSTYKHLQIRYITQAGNGSYLSGQFNGDTGSNYRWHYLNADGSSVSAGYSGSDTRVALPRGSATANIFGVGVVDILDYANTTKNKVTRALGGRDTNGAGQIDYNSGLWLNTAAITSISLFHSGVTIPQYSSFALYGVK